MAARMAMGETEERNGGQEAEGRKRRAAVGWGGRRGSPGGLGAHAGRCQWLSPVAASGSGSLAAGGEWWA